MFLKWRRETVSSWFDFRITSRLQLWPGSIGFSSLTPSCSSGSVSLATSSCLLPILQLHQTLGKFWALVHVAVPHCPSHTHTWIRVHASLGKSPWLHCKVVFLCTGHVSLATFIIILVISHCNLQIYMLASSPRQKFLANRSGYYSVWAPSWVHTNSSISTHVCWVNIWVNVWVIAEIMVQTEGRKAGRRHEE